GRNDVFAGYAVEIRYLEVAQHGDPATYQEAGARLVCSGIDPSFVFELPDQHELALDDRITITVQNRKGEQVFRDDWPMPVIVRDGENLELRIEKVDERGPSPPVLVNGYLQWKSPSVSAAGFAGFRVLASFQVRANDSVDATFTPRLAAT